MTDNKSSVERCYLHLWCFFHWKEILENIILHYFHQCTLGIFWWYSLKILFCEYFLYAATNRPCRNKSSHSLDMESTQALVQSPSSYAFVWRVASDWRLSCTACHTRCRAAFSLDSMIPCVSVWSAGKRRGQLYNLSNMALRGWGFKTKLHF